MKKKARAESKKAPPQKPAKRPAPSQAAKRPAPVKPGPANSKARPRPKVLPVPPKAATPGVPGAGKIVGPQSRARARPAGPGARAASPDPSKPVDDPSKPLELPGEVEFNECIKVPPGRRIKVTLKRDSSLEDLVGWISSMTCKRFIIASNLHSQKVTIISPTAVTAAEAYRAFLSAIEVLGLTVVPSGRYLKVVQGNWAIQSSIPTFIPGDGKRLPRSDQMVTRLVRIKHVDVNQLLLVLNKMKSRSGDITAYKPTNMLIITDGANNVRRHLRIIQELDVGTAADKIWIVQLKHGDVEDVKKILDQVFAANKGAPKIPQLKPPKGKPLPTDEGVPAVSKIIADAATNSLIIVASTTAYARIASLLKKLDVESSGSVSQRIHVYYLENADAEEMAQTLASLTGNQPTRRGRQRRRPNQPANQTASLFEGEVKVSADKPTNSLVIIASTRDYINLRSVVRKLDIPRRQVFVEATILEITLNTDRRVGFAYHGGGITGEGDSESIIFGGVQHAEWGSLLIDPLRLMGLAVGARGAVIEGSANLLGLQTDIAGFGVMFQALQTNSNVNVLSSPHILTTDNEEAEITVGQNIPFQGAFVGGGLGAAAAQAGGAASLLPTVSVQRQDVALKLKLTPHVNDSDMVRLELEQEVSDIVSPNFNNLGPATSKRTAKTTIVVRDQQTVVIGGLMGDRMQDSISKVPLLGDLPILGYLFKYTTKTKQKTNLLIVLTPYVIRDQSDLRRIFEKKLRERREFIERYTSFDPHEVGAEIDYRHKRGLIAEINRVGLQVEEEARLLNQARRTTGDDVDPVEMPRGMSPPAQGPTAVPPAMKPPTPPASGKQPPRPPERIPR